MAGEQMANEKWQIALEAITERLTSLDEAGCEAEAIQLGQQGAAGLSLLAELLVHHETDVRFWAVRGLWANGSAAAVKLLTEALQDPEEMVRSGAAMALGELKAEIAMASLAKVLTADPSACGNHAADALAKIGEAAAPALVEAMGHEQSWVRVRAAKALIPVQSKAAIPALFAALEDDSYVVRQYAEEALARLGVGQMVYFTP